jgi:SET domain-containing protein
MIRETDIADLVNNAPKCEAKQSSLSGFGLFAKEPIQAGETIVDFSDPELYVEKSFDELEEWRFKGGKFTAIDEKRCIISKKFTKYSLLNHSRTPTAILDVGGRRVFAVRLILPGEEITVDYRTEPMPPKVREHFEKWL